MTQHRKNHRATPPEKANPNPKRGYSWPPFEPGHTLSLVHGAQSPRTIAARAAEVHEELLQVAPYLDEPRFLPAVQRYLDAAARESLLHNHVTKVSAEEGPGAVPQRVWEAVTAAARLAGKLASDLGLDPIGHARIRALSVGAEATETQLAQLASRGGEILARREAAIGDVIDAEAEGETHGD